MKSNLGKLVCSTLAFAGAMTVALGSSPRIAMGSSTASATFENCGWGGLPLWCAPGREADLCSTGAGTWLYGCVNNGGAS
jgi:hypothetical protein